MLRLILTGLLAVGLHAGIGKAAFEIAAHMEDPIWLRTRLVDKELLREIRERIAELEKEQALPPDDEIAIELETLDETIAALPGDDGGAMDLSLGFAASLAPPALEPEPEPEPEADPEPEPEPPPPPAKAVAVLTADKTDVKSAEIVDALAELDMQSLRALGGSGRATEGVLDSGSVPTGLLDEVARSSYGAPGGVRGGTLRPGQGGLAARGDSGTGQVRASLGGAGSLRDISNRTSRSTSAKTARVDKKRPKGRVAVGSLSIPGIPDAKATRKIRKKRTAFRRCYQRALARNPELAGSVRLRFEVQADGSVVVGKRDDAVLRELSDPSVASCALGVLAGMRIASPEDGTARGTITLVFSVD